MSKILIEALNRIKTMVIAGVYNQVEVSEIGNICAEAISLHQQQQLTAEEAAKGYVYKNYREFGYVEIGWTEIHLKEYNAFLAGTNFKSKKEVAGAVPEAVSFAEWIRKNSYEPFADRWLGLYPLNNPEMLTTEQLFEIFKQQS